MFAPVNSEPEFVAGLCHWLLVMGTHKSLAVNDERKARENKNSEGDDENRLQAVPFWVVERSRQIAEREKTGANERRGAWLSPSLFSFVSPRSSLAAL